MKKLVSIIAPMYNEEEIVHKYCDAVFSVTHQLNDNYDFEIILVDDGSKDKTNIYMQEEYNKNKKEISVVTLTRNFGLEGAVNAGLQVAKGDAIIVMDADLQDPPSLLPEFIKKWENGADIVVGSRVKRGNDSLFKKLGAGLYYKILDSLSGKLKLEKNAANFRLLSKFALEKLKKLPENNSVFRVTVPFLGMKTDIVEYERDKRFSGKTKYSLKNMIPYALNSITGISVEPLRRIYLFIIISFIVLIISIASSILFNDTFRLIFIFTSFVSFFALMIFIALSIMAEYIAQIMIEVKGRPLSIIYDYKQSENSNERN